METLFTIKEENTSNTYAKFVISPLVAGYGHTLGTALRRVLLTSLPGAAATRVRVEDVKHQFSTLKGMKEDVLDFLLNLKQVRFAYNGTSPVQVTLSAKQAGEVRASDLKLPTGVTVANPDLVLATLSKGGKLEAEIQVESGHGYVPADDQEVDSIGTIALDANFSPVLRVIPKIEETRVGRVTNYDKLTLEVFTDGSIAPRDALTQAAKIMSGYLDQIINPQDPAQPEPVVREDSLGATGKLSVEEIGLPTRVANALSKAGFETVEKLVNAPKEQLVKVRNLGEKSLTVIQEALQEKGVEISYE